MTKKFCPSCGNPSLLRVSVSLTPSANGAPPELKVHLKKNFQYRTRGTIYPIPAPKAGTSKTGTGEGMILREDQVQWQRAEKRDKSRRDKEERKVALALQKASLAETGKMQSWMDPDWLPSMMNTNRNSGGQTDGMPKIGYGKKNPNEKRRRR